LKVNICVRGLPQSEPFTAQRTTANIEGTHEMATTTFNMTALANGTSTLTQRTSALNETTDLVQAGVVFNDATRLLSGGLFAEPFDNHNQEAYLGLYTTDIHAVQDDIAAMLAAPGQVTLGGQAFTLNATDTAVLTEVNSQLSTLLMAAPQSANAATATAAKATLHSVQSEILAEISNDPHLVAALDNVQYLSGTGALNHGFQQLPGGADDPASLAAATGGNSLAAIGAVFNAAANLADGGLTPANITEFNKDMMAVAQGVASILGSATKLAKIEGGESVAAQSLTSIHLQTVLNEVDLQINKVDGEITTRPNIAARTTNDNLLDIIDIVQNDTALNKAAGGTAAPASIGGFAEDPAYLNGAGGVNAKGGTITPYQDSQAQTNFWAAFLAEANTIQAQLNAVATGKAAASQALITQIQNYNSFGANFDALQGGLFGARFDNELLSGTLLADSSNAVAGLIAIKNGATGVALTVAQAQITAAGMGFHADAADVSGNNVPVGGGSYIGTATTVATATSVHGLAMGTIPVTATPNLVNGTGGTTVSTTTTTGTTTTGTGGTTTMTGTTTGTTGTGTTGALMARTAALQLSTDLVRAGAVFNDAVRESLGLFTQSGSGNQTPSLTSYVSDIQAVKNDIAAMLAAPGSVTIGGKAFALNATDTAVLTKVEAQLANLQNAAPMITSPATQSAAQATLNSVQSEILQEINGDSHLAAALGNVPFTTTTGAKDVAFQSLPVGADTPAALAAAAAGTAAIGTVFNALVDRALGGIHGETIGQIENDLNAVSQGISKLLSNPSTLAAIEKGETATAAALTIIHAQTVLNQVNFEIGQYAGMAAGEQTQGVVGTAANLEAIIDEVQNDPTLNRAAGGNGMPGHSGGFAELPGGLAGTVTLFQDNQPQTNFWAAFVAEANTINAQLTAIADGKEALNPNLICQIQNYEAFGSNFAEAQGAVFQGRFDSELVSGTLQADATAACVGLTNIMNGDKGAALAADLAMIKAAGIDFAADASQLVSHNTPAGGGQYVGNAITVATATSIHGLAHGSIPVTCNPNIANGTGGTATSSTTMSGPTMAGGHGAAGLVHGMEASVALAAMHHA
jgi:hypothetical protein